MIIFLYGSDTYRSRKKLEEIKQKFINEVDKSSLNIQKLDGANFETVEFEKAVFTPPFLAKKRLVIVENLISQTKNQKRQKEILDIINKKDLTHAVVIFWEGASASLAKKEKFASKKPSLLLGRLKKEKFAQEFNLLNQSEIQHFIKEYVKIHRGLVDPSAISLLAQITSNDLWHLSAELDKLLAFAGDKLITTNDVMMLTKNKLDDDIFKLTDALGQKNKALALKLISDQLKGGTSPVELLTKITWQFKNLLLIKSFADTNGSGYPDARIGYQLGLHPFVIKKSLAQAKNFNQAKLKEIYHQLLNIDLKLKTSQLDPEVLFDLLVVKS